MRAFFSKLVKHKKLIIAIFAILCIVCAGLKSSVGVNYDINDYLPKDTKSTISIEKMQEEFDGDIPNARVMVKEVTIPEALDYKDKIKKVKGVSSVTWLDDSQDIKEPLEMMDKDSLDTYYKDDAALFSVAIEEEYIVSAVTDIRDIIGDDNCMTGSAVSTSYATLKTVEEIRLITIFAIAFVLFVLFLTTKSWVEPLIIGCGLGVAVIINAGTNIIFGEVSFVTNAAESILQIAVSLDYSVFLIQRFSECLEEKGDANKAMVDALCKSISSIFSSGLTTVIGFLALTLMQFRIGPDLGFALAKGICISLITVFIFMPVLVLSTYKLIKKTKHRPFLPSFEKFGKLVKVVSIPMTILFAIVIVPSFFASNANDYYYGSSYIYDGNTQYGRDTNAIENLYGKSDTYVLMVPKKDNATEKELSNELHKLNHVTDIISYVDTVGAEIPKEYLAEDTLSLLESDNFRRMVISVDLPAEGDETFALIKKVRKIAEKYYGDETYLAGGGVSTYDLMKTVTEDMKSVNFLAIAAVFIVLLLTTRSVVVPFILVLSIETAIWINLSFPYFQGTHIFYLAYLIISTIQLGATVDYAILMTDRYKENRQTYSKKNSVVKTISDTSVSILTSGSVLVVVGFLLGKFSSNQLLSMLGIFIGRGGLCSLTVVFFVLPGLLYIFDDLVTNNRKSKIVKKIKSNKKMLDNNELSNKVLETKEAK